MEVSEYLVGSPAFKAGGTGDPRPAGSIPVHLRKIYDKLLLLNSQKISSSGITTWVTEFRHCSSFNLSYAFTGQAKVFANFFQSSWFSPIQTKTQF